MSNSNLGNLGVPHRCESGDCPIPQDDLPAVKKYAQKNPNVEFSKGSSSYKGHKSNYRWEITFKEDFKISAKDLGYSDDCTWEEIYKGKGRLPEDPANVVADDVVDEQGGVEEDVEVPHQVVTDRHINRLLEGYEVNQKINTLMETLRRGLLDIAVGAAENCRPETQREIKEILAEKILERASQSFAGNYGAWLPQRLAENNDELARKQICQGHKSLHCILRRRRRGVGRISAFIPFFGHFRPGISMSRITRVHFLPTVDFFSALPHS